MPSARTECIRAEWAQRAQHRAAVAAAPLAVRTAYASIPVALRQRDRALALQLAGGYAQRPGFSPTSFSPEAETWTRGIRDLSLSSTLAGLPARTYTPWWARGGYRGPEEALAAFAPRVGPVTYGTEAGQPLGGGAPGIPTEPTETDVANELARALRSYGINWNYQAGGPFAPSPGALGLAYRTIRAQAPSLYQLLLAAGARSGFRDYGTEAEQFLPGAVNLQPVF